MNKVLIDTNFYSDALRGHSLAVSVLKSADLLFMTPVVIAELLAGFELGSRREANRMQLQKFLLTPRVQVVDITKSTSDYYAHIFTALRNAGTPIPTNDIWIAACTMENGAKLATSDRHFGKVKGLLTLPFST